MASCDELVSHFSVQVKLHIMAVQCFAGASGHKTGKDQPVYLKVRVLRSGMGAAMLAMAAGLHLKQLASLSSTIAITGTVAYMVFFALGAGPVPGLLVPEVTPARLRGERASYHVSLLPPQCF